MRHTIAILLGTLVASGILAHGQVPEPNRLTCNLPCLRFNSLVE